MPGDGHVTAELGTRLANRILWGLLIGAAAGGVTLLIGEAYPPLLEAARKFATLVLEPIGQVFLRMLFFVIIPLIFASLATGVAQLDRLSQLGPMAVRTFILFFLNMAIAVTLGLVMMNLLEPGHAMDPESRARLLQEYGGDAAAHVAKRADAPDVTPMAIVEMFMPRNLFGAFVGNNRNALGDVLPLILFAILVGAAALKLAPARREQLRSGLSLVNDLMTGIVHFALRLAPFAVPAMIYSVVVKIGWDIVIALGVFVAGCIAMMLLHLFGTMSVWLRLLARRNPLETFKLMRPVLATAFSTSSSAASLPTALAAAREDLGVQGARRRLRASARHHHEHVGHRPVRGLRGAVHRPGVRHRARLRAAGHAGPARRPLGGRGVRDSGRRAADGRGAARGVRHPARGHWHHPRRRAPARHDAHHGQRGL